jgi:hypothetical protein
MIKTLLRIHHPYQFFGSAIATAAPAQNANAIAKANQ